MSSLVLSTILKVVVTPFIAEKISPERIGDLQKVSKSKTSKLGLFS